MSLPSKYLLVKHCISSTVCTGISEQKTDCYSNNKAIGKNQLKEGKSYRFGITYLQNSKV